MPEPLRNILVQTRIALVIVIGLLIIVWPLAETMINVSHQVLLCSGAAIAVGVGIGLRLGRDGGIGLGLGVGSVVGIVSTIVFTLLRDHQSPAIIIPPIVGIGIGFIDGIRAEKLRGLYRPLLVGVSIGGLIGLGTIPSYDWRGLIVAIMAGVFVGTAAGLRLGSTGRWRDGLQFPPMIILLLNLAMLIVGGALIATDESPWLSSWWMILPAVPLLVLYPVVSFILGRVLAVWLRPRIQVHRELMSYLRVMWIPMGAFALGYAIIILVFAGFYGTLYKYVDASPFQGVSNPDIFDWLFFSFLTATTMGSETVIPVTRFAQLIVGLETIAGLSWILIMFAIVMSHLQPQFEDIARRTGLMEERAMSNRSGDGSGR